MTPKSFLQIDESPIIERVRKFEQACWAYKRRESQDEPKPQDFGLGVIAGEAILRLVHQQHEDEVRSKLKHLKPI